MIDDDDDDADDDDDDDDGKVKVNTSQVPQPTQDSMAVGEPD